MNKILGYLLLIWIFSMLFIVVGLIKSFEFAGMAVVVFMPLSALVVFADRLIHSDNKFKRINNND